MNKQQKWEYMFVNIAISQDTQQVIVVKNGEPVNELLVGMESVLGYFNRLGDEGWMIGTTMPTTGTFVFMRQK